MKMRAECLLNHDLPPPHPHPEFLKALPFTQGRKFKYLPLELAEPPAAG